MKLSNFFILGLFILGFIFSGCSNGDSTSSELGNSITITGAAIDDPVAGATIEIYDDKGNLLAVEQDSTDANGNYEIDVDASKVIDSTYLVIVATKEDKKLYSVILGYKGESEYKSNETFISHFSTAAYLISRSFSEPFDDSYDDFLLSYKDAIYDANSSNRFQYKYYEILEDVASDVKNYFYFSQPLPEKATMLTYMQAHSRITQDDLQVLSDNNQSILNKLVVADDNNTVVNIKINMSENNITQNLNLRASIVSYENNGLNAELVVIDTNGTTLRNVEVDFNQEESQDSQQSTQAFKQSSREQIANTAFQDLCYDLIGKKQIFELVEDVIIVTRNTNLCEFITNVQLNYSPDESSKYSLDISYIQQPQNLLVRKVDLGGGLIQVDPNDTIEKVTLPLLDTRYLISLDVEEDLGLAFTSATTFIPLLRLYATTDILRENNALLSYKTLESTRADASYQLPNNTNVFNNFLDSQELKQPIPIDDTITHRIVDFDNVLKPGATLPNEVWNSASYASGKPGDNGRIPLLLVHGWQGSYGLREPAILGTWDKSELHYWHHFLAYYLTSEALQEKYHVYLYHYTSYKHVTYNAQKLKELLDTVKTTVPESDLAGGLTDSSKGVTILAHSMGGLVARALVEEHKYFGTDLTHLNKLIALDTPHHGSVASENYAPQNLPKDLLTQGAGDLNWDNYDSAYSAEYITDNNKDNRWSDTMNNWAFDYYYCNSSILETGACAKTANPYLSYLNAEFESGKEQYKEKYIYYAAWNVHDWQKWTAYIPPVKNIYVDLLKVVANKTLSANYNKELDFIGNGSMNISTILMGHKGYAAGGAEPVGSAFLSDAISQDTTIFNSKNGYYPTFSDQSLTLEEDMAYLDETYEIPVLKYLEEVCVKYDENYECIERQNKYLPLITKSNGTDHPYDIPYRLFWDYDHEKIFNGTYSGDAGTWDKYINQGDFLASAANDSAFKQYHSDYINAALQIRYGREFSITSDKINPLKYEPVFLAIEKDLVGNNALIANAGEDQFVELGTDVILDGRDSDGIIETYIWTDNGPIIGTTESFTTSSLVLGIHNIQLKVIDDFDKTATDTVVITIYNSDSDADKDGMPDKWEIANGLDPLVDDSLLDNDNDGVTNLQEYQDEINPSEEVLLAKVTDLYPLTATQNENITFTITGENLPATISMSLHGSSRCESLTYISSTSATVVCTPYITGTMDFYVATKPLGAAISSDVTLQVEVAKAPTKNICDMPKDNHTLASLLFNLDIADATYDNPGFVTAEYLMEPYDYLIPGVLAHAGTDFRSKNGAEAGLDEVYSLTSGTVVRAENGTNYGIVAIQTKNKANEDIVVFYAHLDSTPLKVPDTVEIGTLIGLSGKLSGIKDDIQQYTLPHLHIEYSLGTGTSMLYKTSCGGTECTKTQIEALTNDPIELLSISCTPANTDPTASPQTITVEQESQNNTITLTATDADTTDTLTYTIVTNPTNGTLSGTAPNLTYTPTTNYSGEDSFTFKVNDGTVDSVSATVSITVNATASAVLKTGQITSYTDFDDGYYQKGLTRSYIRDDVKNIVTDNITGLMWEDYFPSFIGMIWEDAVTYCQNLSLSGYTDWRLPDIKELQSIVDYGKYESRYGDAIDTAFQYNMSRDYWSSSVSVVYPNYVWTVSFYNGARRRSHKTNDNSGVDIIYKDFVRCVRIEQ